MEAQAEKLVTGHKMAEPEGRLEHKAPRVLHTEIEHGGTPRGSPSWLSSRLAVPAVLVCGMRC